MTMRSFLLRASLAAITLWSGLTGCATVQSADPYWGRDARPVPGWGRVKHAAVTAARSPLTWAPMLGALAVQAYDLDDEIAERAMQHTPIFGSTSGADRASNVLRAASWVFYATTGSVAPSSVSEPAWRAKLKGFVVGVAAMGVTQGFTAGLKEVTERQRPNMHDDRSFPSGHASNTALTSRLTQRNLEYLDLAPGSGRALNAGLGAITAMTAWARVEAGEHHLSDVLVGSALGNFLGVVFQDAFLGRAGIGRAGIGRAGIGRAGTGPADSGRVRAGLQRAGNGAMQTRFEVSSGRVLAHVNWDL